MHCQWKCNDRERQIAVDSSPCVVRNDQSRIDNTRSQSTNCDYCSEDLGKSFLVYAPTHKYYGMTKYIESCILQIITPTVLFTARVLLWYSTIYFIQHCIAEQCKFFLTWSQTARFKPGLQCRFHNKREMHSVHLSSLSPLWISAFRESILNLTFCSKLILVN